jgi:hypothetical protein
LGQFCELSNPCLISNPCRNGGSCQPTGGSSLSSYICSCPTGFYGQSCEQQDACRTGPNPCRCVLTLPAAAYPFSIQLANYRSWIDPSGGLMRGLESLFILFVTCMFM